MKSLATSLFLLFGLSCFAAQTLVKRELFTGLGTITSGSPDQFDSMTGNLYCRPVGPKTDGVSPDYSADPHGGGFLGLFNTTTKSTTNGILGAWFWIDEKSASSVNQLATVQDAFGETMFYLTYNPNSANALTWQATTFDSYGTTNTVAGSIPFYTWVYVAAAWKCVGTNTYWQYYEMTNGASSLALIGTSQTLAGVNTKRPAFVGAIQVYPSGLWNGRVGAESLYSLDSFSDVSYPSDLNSPPTTPNNWYVNPATGSDTNSGLASNAAWQTIAKVATESDYAGLIGTANGWQNGDTLNIDTSSAPLDFFGCAYYLETRGLNIQPVSGQTWVTFRYDRTVTNWTQTAGLANAWQTTDNTATDLVSTVVWENNKWLNQPLGANFTSISNSLATVAGSFWCDGTNMFLHTFESGNPNTDGNTYTRSRNFNATPLVIDALDNHVKGLFAGKTTLSDNISHDPIGDYCIQFGASTLGNTFAENCYFYYGSKHILGITYGGAASTVTISNVDCEQGSPYTVGQNPFVDYVGNGLNIQTLLMYNCKCLKVAGLIGSTNGAANNGIGAYLTHNDGGLTNQFHLQYFSGCDFSGGTVTAGISDNVILTNCKAIGLIVTSTSRVDQCSMGFVSGYAPQTHLTAFNDIFDVNSFLASGGNGQYVSGYYKFFNDTFDMRTCTSGDYYRASLFVRQTNLTMIATNDIFIWPPVVSPLDVGGDIIEGATNTDTILFGNNVYVLSTNLLLAYNYCGTNLTFAQWQALGFDGGSVTTTNIMLNATYVPLAGSPVINAGLNLYSYFTSDYAGNTRPATGAWTSGAYQVASGSAAAIITTVYLPAVTGSGGTLKLAWPADYIGWILQMQTNSLKTGLSANWVDVPGSSTITQTNLGIDPAMPLMFYRLRSP